MGNEYSNEENIEDNYDIKQFKQDGSLLLKHKKTKQQYQLRSHCSNIQDEMIGFRQLLQKRKQIKSTHLLDLVQIKDKKQKQVCSILHRLYLLIQFPFKTLNLQILQRKNKPSLDYFSQDQLWSILYSCSVALHTLYLNKFNHQCLSSKQIYINKDGLVKISDPILLGLQKNYITVLKKINKENAPLSPEVMNFLDDCNFSFYDKENSDVFVLGTIMLEASLLKQINLYDIQDKKPKLYQIPILLEEVKNRYSQTYFQMLQKMLQLHSKNRPKLGQIILRIQQQNNLLQDTDQTQNRNQSIKPDKSSFRLQTVSASNPQLQLKLQSKPLYTTQQSKPTHRIQQSKSIYHLQQSKPTYRIQQPTYRIQQPKTKYYFQRSKPINQIQPPQQLHYQHVYQPHPQIINQPQNNFLNNLHHQNIIKPQSQTQTQQHMPISQNKKINFIVFLNQQKAPDTIIRKLNNQNQNICSAHNPPLQTFKDFSSNKRANQFYTIARESSPIKEKVHISPHSQINSFQRFSYKNFANISVQQTKKQNKNQELYSYDIPEIRDILIQQKKDSSIHNNIKSSNYNYVQTPQSPVVSTFNSQADILNTPTNSILNSHISNINNNSDHSQNALSSYFPKNQLKYLEQYKSPQNIVSHKSSLKFDNIMPQIPQQIHYKYSSSQIFSQDSKKLVIRKLQSDQKSRGSFPSRSFSKQDILQDICSNGQIISSNFHNNNDCQWVCQILDGGARYQGYKKNGMKNGHGKLHFRDGGFYQGEWKNNMMYGYGKLHYQNGQIAYQGQWIDDQFNGQGRVFNDHPEIILGQFNYYDFGSLDDKWVFYEGDFKNDSKHGKGKIKLTNGQVFQGTFIYDTIQGEGKFYSIGGQAIKGYWIDNILTDH